MSGRITGCAVPGPLDANDLKDQQAERVVLYGLMHDHDALVPILCDMGFVKGSLYYDSHQRLYEALMYVHNGSVDGPILAETFQELLRRVDLCDRGEFHDLATWLIDIWINEPWFAEIKRWADMSENAREMSFYTWVASAAAYKVHHLTSRRAAIYAAKEVIRDALSPTGSADEIDNQTGKKLGEEYW